ncbi:MAG: hypothetical protein MZV63_17870 [Marinilabiliales bacterium]|nr:hypothetical protein [Marinilabiliales bacterium]
MPTGTTGTGCITLTKGWVFREHAPNATAITLVGTFSGWKEDDRYRLHRTADGDWIGEFDEEMLSHGDLYKMNVRWKGGGGERIPAYATRTVQDEVTKIFTAQVWHPDGSYVMRHPSRRRRRHSLSTRHTSEWLPRRRGQAHTGSLPMTCCPG